MQHTLQVPGLCATLRTAATTPLGLRGARWLRLSPVCYLLASACSGDAVTAGDAGGSLTGGPTSPPPSAGPGATNMPSSSVTPTQPALDSNGGAAGASPCTAPQIECNGACVDVLSSPTNCGSCGVSCDPLESCQQGSCLCANGSTSCGSDCVDTSSNPNHCGGCGAACNDSESCSNGTCSASCANGLTECNRACVDTQTDQQNCGACGGVCPAGQQCNDGSCGCANGDSLCGNSCVDINNDEANCGSCFNVCVGNEQCNNGSCQLNCNGNQTACNGACVNTNTDEANCGACGEACNAGDTCTGGQCIAPPPPIMPPPGGLPPEVGACNPTGTCPGNITCPLPGADCGCFQVPGLGANKRAFLEVGADPYMIASGMLETDALDAQAYPTCDVTPEGAMKTNDACNAGIAKQNWFMMRNCHPDWDGLNGQAFQTGLALNTDIALDAQVYRECRAFYGNDWWAGHRNGSAGVNNPNTQDITEFKAVMDWTYDRLVEGGHFCDDLRFYVTVENIVR